MNRILCTVAVSLVMLLGNISTASAAKKWFAGCEIVRIGIDSTGTVLVKLKHKEITTDNDQAWFKVVTTPDRSLSILLTALSTGRAVKINAEDPVSEQSHSVIYLLYVDM